MHGLTLRASRTVLPRGLKNPPSLTPVVDREEGPIDRAERAVTHTVGHNSVATFDGSRESVLEPRGNAQPEFPLRGFPRLKTRESTKWIFRLRVSSVLKYAFAWSVEGSHRVVTNGVRYSAYSPVNGAFLPAYSERQRRLAIQPAR